MEFIRFATMDSQKITADAVAVLPRKVVSTSSGGASGTAASSGSSAMGGGGNTVIAHEMVLGPKEEMQLFLYLGSSDGCVTMYSVAIGVNDSSTPSSSSSMSTMAMPGASYRATATQTQKRKLVEDVDGPVSYLQLDDQLRDARLLVLCNGHVSMLHPNSLDPIAAFQNTRALEGCTACCIAQGQTESRRLAAIVKRQLIICEYTENTCTVLPPPPGCQGLVVPDHVLQMAWHHNVILCGTKREYTLYDARTFSLVDSVVVDKMITGPLLRVLPNYHFSGASAGSGGCVVIRHGDTLVFYDGKPRQPIDSSARVGFSEPVVDVAHCHPFLVGFKSDGKVLLRSVIDEEEVPVSATPVSTGTPPKYNASAPLLLACSTTYSIGALVVLPPIATVSRYIERGLYDRALKHYEHFFAVDGDSGSVGHKYVEGLRKIQHACAIHAIRAGKLDVAFTFLELADTRPEKVVRAIAEFQRPSSSSSNDAAGSPTNTTSSPLDIPSFSIHDTTGYQLLYQFLKRTRVSVLDSNGRLSSSSSSSSDVDFALFLLLLNGKVECGDEDLNDLFLPACSLNVDECLPLVEAVMNAESNSSSSGTTTGGGGRSSVSTVSPSLRVKFKCLLLASAGRYSDALCLCREEQLVSEAVVPLQLSGDTVLYTEHLPWMLELNPAVAIKALVSAPSLGTTPPPVDAMLPLVLPIGGTTLSTYLSFVIHRQRNTDSHLHTIHALNLIETVQELRRHGAAGWSSRTESLWVPPGLESGLLGEVRQQLLAFLSSNVTHFDSDAVIGSLTKAGGLADELVATYRSCQEHELALQTLVYRLRDYDAAVQYCIDLQAGRSYHWRRGYPASTGSESAAAAAAAAAASNEIGLLTDPGASQLDSFGGALGVNNSSVTSNSNDSDSRAGGGGGGGGAHRGAGGASSSFAGSAGGDNSFTSVVTPLGGGARMQGGDSPGKQTGTRRGSTVLQRIGSGSASRGSLSSLGSGNHLTSQQLQQQQQVHSAPQVSPTTKSSAGYNEYFNILLRVLLVPPAKETAHVVSALHLLRHHAQEINAVSVVRTLPGDVPLGEIAGYLISTFHSSAARLTLSRISAQCAASEKASVSRYRSILTQRCVYVDDDRLCVVCGKKLGDAVIGVFPNLKVAHFRCFKDRDIDPERGLPFQSTID